METIKGENFEVHHDREAQTVTCSGALRLSGMEEYTPILEMLRRLFDESAELITLDLRRLELLNSSGITMFSKFVIEARDKKMAKLRVLGSAAVPWQGRSLKNLQRLMPALQIDLT